MANNKEPRKQHFVPQFILKNFAIGNKNRIYVFDLKTGKSFASHVKDSAHENDFYHHPVEGNRMEFELGKQEAKVAPVISKIISNASVRDLTADEVNSLGLFTIIQMLRVNSIRESLTEMAEMIFEGLAGDTVATGSQAEELLTFLHDMSSKDQSIDMLKEIPVKLLPHLLDKHLSLVQAPKGESFYISDNPIVKYNHQPQKLRGNLGLAVKGIEIHFPLSPKYCLSYLCSELVDDVRTAVMRNQSAVVMGLEPANDQSVAIEMLNGIYNKETKVLTSANMDYHNSLQVFHCSRFVYSSSGDFRLLKKMLRDNPSIAAKKRIVDGSKSF